MDTYVRQPSPDAQIPRRPTTSNGVNVIALSIGRSILEAGSRERERMRGYAQNLSALHMVILTRKEHGFKDEIHEGNLHLYPTNSRSRFCMLKDAYRLGKHISRQISDCVITSQDPFEMGLIAFLLAKAVHGRFHMQVHGDYFSMYWGTGSPLRLMRRMLARFLMVRAHGIRVVSERIRHSLIANGVPDKRITILPIRPELETFLGVERTPKTDNDCTFLVASRFSPEKNIPLILRAFARVKKSRPEVLLRIVGRGSEEKHIRTLTRELGIEGDTTILPWTESIEKEMQGADVFLSASDHEAYGLTLIEAMASGLPIVSTDVGCVGEVVKDGVHGIVVPVRDESAFAHGMERMVTDRAFSEACGMEGRKTAGALASTSPDTYMKAWVASLL